MSKPVRIGVSTLALGIASVGFSKQLDPDFVHLRTLGTLPWTDDARSYEKIVAEAEGVSGSLPLLRRMHTQAHEAFEKRPIDPVLAFRWATFLFAHRDREPVPTFDQENARLKEAMMRIPFVANYPYARVRFLVESNYFETPILVPWGDRLLKKSPNDPRVLYAQSGNLAGEKSITEVRRGLALAEKILKLRPGSGMGHVAVASAHYRLWRRTKDQDEATKAIASYRRYLSVGKPDGDTRSRVDRLIKRMGGLP